jgi:rod shape-determining protein MreC
VRDTRRTRIALAALLVAALALIANDYLGGSALLRATGGTVFGTAERGISSVTQPIAGFVANGVGPAGPSSQVQALERQLTMLRAQLSSEQLNRTQHAQLVKLLRIQGRGRYQIVAANVIAVGQGFEHAVTLNVGSADGVRPDETVLNGAGLVGTVTEVSPWTCTVLLATDTTAVAGVRLVGSGQLGWVSGAGPSLPGELLRLRVLGPSSKVLPGQQLVTSASVGDRPYVAGVPVGVITSIEPGAGALTQTALVRPYVDFTALDVVGVVVAGG